MYWDIHSKLNLGRYGGMAKLAACTSLEETQGRMTAWTAVYGMNSVDMWLTSLTVKCRRLPMARVRPPSQFYMKPNPVFDASDISLPPQKLQDELIDIYFTYVHPIFPVIHKSRFLSEYQSR